MFKKGDRIIITDFGNKEDAKNLNGKSATYLAEGFFHTVVLDELYQESYEVHLLDGEFELSETLKFKKDDRVKISSKIDPKYTDVVGTYFDKKGPFHRIVLDDKSLPVYNENKYFLAIDDELSHIEGE